MKAALIALGVLSATSILALAWKMASPPPPNPRMAELETELKEAKQTIAQLRKELALKPVPPPVAVATPKSAVPGAPAQPPGMVRTSNSGQGANLREMLANPAMRAMVEQQQAVQIDVGYARLFEYLQLNDQERSHLRKLLVDRLKMETDFGIRMMEPGLTQDQRRELAAQLQQQKGTYDSTIKSFLNDDNDWKAFQHWEDTQPERTQLDSVGRNLFTASGEPLNPIQEQQLVDLMAQVRKTNSQVQVGSGVDAVQRQILQMEANDKVVFERAGGFLTPTQMRTLQNFQQQTQTMMRAGLQMSQQMMGGSR